MTLIAQLSGNSRQFKLDKADNMFNVNSTIDEGGSMANGFTGGLAPDWDV